MMQSPPEDDYESRAYAAEDDLYRVIQELREFQEWLMEPTRGPVIFRAEVVERLNQILV